MKTLTWQQYNDLEDEFIHRIKKKVEIGHCTSEAATRQELGILFEKFRIIEPVTRIHFMNPNAVARINITDEESDPKNTCPSYSRFFKTE